MKAQDLLARLNPYVDTARLLGFVRVLGDDDSPSLPICVPKGLTVGKLRYTLGNLIPEVELIADISMVDTSGVVISEICKPTGGDSECDLMAELDNILGDSFETVPTISVMPDFEALTRAVTERNDDDLSGLGFTMLGDPYDGMTPEEKAEWDEKRLRDYVRKNGNKNPVTLDFTVNSLDFPQDNEAFMRAIFIAAHDAGCTMTYTPQFSYCGLGFHACGCQIKIVDGDGFIGYYTRDDNGWNIDYIVEYTNGKRISAKELAAKYPPRDEFDVLNGYNYCTEAYNRIIAVLHEIDPSTTEDELHERIEIAVNSRRLTPQNEWHWYCLRRKTRKGVQNCLHLDTNERLTYQIEYQYADDSNKRSRKPVCYKLYEELWSGIGRKSTVAERFIGTYSSEQAAKDAAYEAYLTYYPGAVGRYAPNL